MSKYEENTPYTFLLDLDKKKSINITIKMFPEQTLYIKKI
jgi:hypothetical protein